MAGAAVSSRAVSGSGMAVPGPVAVTEMDDGAGRGCPSCMAVSACICRCWVALLLEPLPVSCVNVHEVICVLRCIWASECRELRCNLKKKMGGIGSGKSQP